jgi:hypothetical protein
VAAIVRELQHGVVALCALAAGSTAGAAAATPPRGAFTPPAAPRTTPVVAVRSPASTPSPLVPREGVSPAGPGPVGSWAEVEQHLGDVLGFLAATRDHLARQLTSPNVLQVGGGGREGGVKNAPEKWARLLCSAAASCSCMLLHAACCPL